MKPKEKIMTPEDKQLLFQDLSARLSYGVMAIPIEGVGFEPVEVTSITTGVIGPKVTLDGCLVLPINRVAPYLRPMSSMTEEEKKELKFMCNASPESLTDVYWINGGFVLSVVYKNQVSICVDAFDWLNQHHFDYRGLIPKGLAIEVTKDNNPY